MTTLKIPIKNGSILIKDDPFSTKISGTILYVSWLCRAGIVPIFSALLLLLIVFNVLVTTSFLNDCWWIDVVPGEGTIVSAAETSSPHLFEMNPVSLSSHKWHEQLGYACDKVVLSFLKQHVPNAPTAILDTIKQLQVCTGITPKVLRTNNAQEFTSAAFSDSLAKLGVAFYPSLPYSPQENGEAERLNRTLGNMARAMVTQSRMPMHFWQFSYASASFIHNQIPNSRCLKSLPHQELFRQAPSWRQRYCPHTSGSPRREACTKGN
ncbi:hypothetical protein O181_028347 [Austropuccinia psidii MF-1]|uniref:Integrase catalytic domain-containing protein n=1 Tax=Austropuccinia psidii MF-1 TaxID=1389203 RepID=A0A9Q3CRQ3_9BASI|nr:hypothetical protein [Austropuccinia psidii MF-1]